MSTVVTDNVQDSGGSSLLGRRNAIINGNFGVNQRGVSGTVSLSAGEYGHDRWKAGASGATYTFSTSGGVTTIDISAGSLIQVVEDVNVVTDTYVLSFEGTAQGQIGGGSFGDSGVTESVTGGSNLNIEFNTGTISNVQLEVGNKPTPFEHRSFGEEFALCQRYYYQLGPDLKRFGVLGEAVIPTLVQFNYVFPVKMRSSPSLLTDANFSDYKLYRGNQIESTTQSPGFTPLLNPDGDCWGGLVEINPSSGFISAGQATQGFGSNNAFFGFDAEL